MSSNKRKKRPFKVEKKMDAVYLPSLKALIDRLFQEAYDQKLTWEALATKSGLSSSTVRNLGRYETRYPGFRTVQLIAVVLGGQCGWQTGPGRKKVITWVPKVFDGKAA